MVGVINRTHTHTGAVRLPAASHRAVRAGVSRGVGERFGLEGAEAGADGPRRVVSQTLLASEPAPHALTSAALHVLWEEKTRSKVMMRHSTEVL